MGNKVVPIGALGLCEHCQTLISIENMPMEAMDAEWKCPKCGEIISGKSFGYDKENEKVCWVKKGRKWTNEKPKDDFDLGELFVIVGPNRPLYPAW